VVDFISKVFESIFSQILSIFLVTGVALLVVKYFDGNRKKKSRDYSTRHIDIIPHPMEKDIDKVVTEVVNKIPKSKIQQNWFWSSPFGQVTIIVVILAIIGLVFGLS